MSVKYVLSLLAATLFGYLISPSYSAETIFCSGFEGCPAADPALEARVAALEALLADVSRGTDPNTGQDTLKLTGMNLQVVDGTDNTDGLPNGTGNVIIGYNETGNPLGDFRTGSHMLVIGRYNTYTSYGGMVVGANNTVTGAQASVSGGSSNTASGIFASISGGYFHLANGTYASISGGFQNTASNEYASINGGSNNTASGLYSSVTGGSENTASGNWSSVSGGSKNLASDGSASVSGGYENSAIASNASVSGGMQNTASGFTSTVSGGDQNTASGTRSSVSGGSSNTANGDSSSVSGGNDRTALIQYCWEGGGLNNC